MHGALYDFKIPIGDWSDDGHGECQWFVIRSMEPVETWREAFLAAKAEYPDLSPDGENLNCQKIENWPVQRIKETIGFDVVTRRDELRDDVLLVLYYVIAFCKTGTPGLQYEILQEPKYPMLPFYDFDKKGRHIGHMGYELFM